MTIGKLYIICKAIFSIFFGGLFIFHVWNYTFNYLKFGSSPMINEYGLAWMFNVLLFCEIQMALLIWFSNKLLNFVNDLVVILYFPLMIVMLTNIYNITGGCISCHISVFEPFELGYFVLLWILIALLLMYLFVRSKKKYISR